MILVENIKETINRKYIHPFKCPNKTDLLNIVTGEKALSTDLVNAKSKGLEAIQIAKNNNSDTIQPPELITFVQKIKKSSKTQTLIKIYQDETTITRTLCFFHDGDNETRRKVFSHEWTPYPASLFEADPTLDHRHIMRKDVNLTS